MIQEPGKLDQAYFKKVLAGTKGYVSDKVTKELKNAGLGRILQDKHSSKDKALQAIKHLQGEGLLSKGKPAYRVYREAGLKQVRQQEEARLENQKKMGRIYIAMELAEDQKKYQEQGGKSIAYDPRSVLGKQSDSVLDDIEEKRYNRNRRAAEEKSKIDQLNSAKNPRGTKPNLVDITNLPDMDIG